MKILFVAARLCYPLNTGAKIRAWHILQNLARRHQVTMVTYYGDQEESRHFARFEELGIRLVPVFNPAIDRGVTASTCLRSLTSDLPLTVAKYYSSPMKRVIRRLLREGFDAVHCEHLHVFPLLKDTGIPVVLDCHNVESQITGRYAAVEPNPLKRGVLAWNHGKLASFEKRAARTADMLLAVSGEDRHAFREFGAGDVRVVDNGVDVDYFAPSATEGKDIVFVGSMDWKPNQDGMNYFLDEILPLIRRSHPEVAVRIVGKAPAESLIKRAETEKGVEVTGTVDDVRPYLERAAVCIVPLRVGGGTRLKVLEGFAMGKAVVSTTLGCEGIACRDRKELLIADDAPSFAQAVSDVLRDRALAKSLGKTARQLVEQKYSWPALGSRMLSYYDHLLAESRGREGGAAVALSLSGDIRPASQYL